MILKKQAIRINRLGKIKKKLSYQAKTAFRHDDIIFSDHRDPRNSIPVITTHKGAKMYSYTIGDDRNTSDRDTKYAVYYKLAESQVLINPTEKELYNWIFKVTNFRLKQSQWETYLQKYRVLKRGRR